MVITLRAEGAVRTPPPTVASPCQYTPNLLFLHIYIQPAETQWEWAAI
jgi:hypothetical protein